MTDKKNSVMRAEDANQLGGHIDKLSEERQFPRAGKLRIGETVIKCPSCKEPNPVHEMDSLENPTCFKCGKPFDMDLSDAYQRRKRGYPRVHEHFRFAPEPGFEHLADRYKEEYGDKPKLITAYLPLWPTGEGTPNYGQVIRQLFYQSYQFWGASGKKCEGDGINAKRLNTAKEYDAVECLGRNCKAFNKGDCKIRATLNLFLPCFRQPVIVQIDTGSPNNIIKINSALELLYAMTAGEMYQPIGLSVIIAKTRKGQAPFINVVWPESLELEMSEMVIDRNLLAAREGTAMLSLPEPGQPELEDTFGDDFNGNGDKAKRKAIRRLELLVDKCQLDGTDLATIVQGIDKSECETFVGEGYELDVLSTNILIAAEAKIKEGFPELAAELSKEQSDLFLERFNN